MGKSKGRPVFVEAKRWQGGRGSRTSCTATEPDAASATVSAKNGRPFRLATALAALSATGCASIPEGATAVDAVDFEGTDVVSASDIEDNIATSASPKFLMLFRGVVYDYVVFDRFVLAKDLERVEAFYHAHGFYEAHARAGRVEYVSANHVRVTITVEEGPPSVVKDLALDGLEGLSPEIQKAARRAAIRKIHNGIRFEEDLYEQTDDAIKRALTDRGYAYARTTRRAEVDLPGHFVNVFYRVEPGPPAKFGDVTVEGLGNLPEGPVRRAVDIAPGARYSTAAIDSAKQAVLDLGVFSNVTITPQLPDPPPADVTVPLVVKLEQSKLHQVTLGGGVEFDPIKTDLHLIGGWEDNNFLGGFRKFRAFFQPGVVLYPLRLQTPLDPPTNLLPEEKAHIDLRQPGFIEARTSGLLQSEVNTYPILLTPEQGAPGQPVLGYFEYKGAAGVDRTFGKFYFAPSYNFQTNTPFPYVGEKDASLTTIVLSYVELFGHYDHRDDRIHPHKGFYIQNDVQFAGLGGTASDVREQPEARLYIPLSRRVTWGIRGTVGFLFPFNYKDPSATPGLAESNPTLFNRESQILFFRGFYSGGSSSNRGYALRGVGPHGIIPFFNPGVAAQNLAHQCDPNARDANNQSTYDVGRCALPLGGLSLWELSTEVRYLINGPLEGATFCDASDVSSGEASIRSDGGVTRLHLSCGVGVRYDTPVGPIRLDVGYRIPGLNPNFDDPNVVATEGKPGTIFGAPIAIAFGIGESF